MNDITNTTIKNTSVWAKDFWDIAIMIGLAAFVVMLVKALFSGRTEPKLSPQREIAIATGHTDRRTLFENPLIRPLLWILLSITHSMNMPKLKNWVNQQLVAAGSPDYFTPEEYITLSLFYGLSFAGLLELFSLLATGSISVSAFFLGILFGTGLSLFSIKNSAQNRLLGITKKLPYTLDLISLAMGAGATFVEATKTVIKDDPEDQFNIELQAVLSEMEYGTTRRQALENMADRVPIPSVQNLVSSIIQAEELGTPLAKVLRDQSQLLRMQRSVRAEQLAASASIKILIPSLLLLLAAVLTIFGPSIINISKNGMF